MRYREAMRADRSPSERRQLLVAHGLMLFAATALVFATAAQAQQTQPMELGAQSSQQAGAADPLPGIQTLLEQGEALFNSADQPESISVFSDVIVRIDAFSDSIDAVPILARSLSYRAQALFNLGQESEAEADMRRLLQVAPWRRLDPTLVSPKLIELFDALRADIVGEIALTLSPETARVYVDGRQVETTLEPIALAEGLHTLNVQMLGHTTYRRDIEIVAGELLTIDVLLERSSTIVTVRTELPGAKVTVDGRAVGETNFENPHDPSTSVPAIITFDGIEGGTHRIEITRDGYRPHSGEITVENLGEYRLDPVKLRRLAGTVVIQRLPAGADLLIDDRVINIPASSGTYEIELAPGPHTITVDAASLGSFSNNIEVMDRHQHEVNVELRPSVYFLGVVGDDDVGRASLVEVLEPILASGRWNQLALPQRDADDLASIGLQIDALRAQARSEDPRAGHWRFEETQKLLDSQAPASLYVFAVLSDDLVATHAEIWAFPGGPGPAFGDHVRVPLDSDESIGTRINTELLDGGSSFTRPWLGASFIDSINASGPVALSVSPSSPASEAGLSPGDVVVAVNGISVSTTTELELALDGLAIDAQVEFRLTIGNISIPLGKSVQIVDPDSVGSPFASLLIAVRQLRSAEDSSVPEWVLSLNEAAILLRAGEWEQVVRLLRPLQVPERGGVGASMASYWLGLALSELGPDYAGLARDSFELAATNRDGRLLHDDGPLVWPLARARARRLQR